MFSSSAARLQPLLRAAVTACSEVTEKTLFGIALLAGPLGAGAFGADLEVRRPVAPPPAPYVDWSGPYIGLAVGSRYNAVDANVTSATVGTPPVAIALPPVSEPEANALQWWGQGPGAMQYLDNIAIRGGIYAGWNYQVAPNYVIGVEADFGFANETAVVHGSPYPANLLFGSPTLAFGASPRDEFRVTTTWDGSARLRGGWLPTPWMMLYLTGGVAWAHIEAESRCSDKATPNVSNCAPGNYFGGTLEPVLIKHSATKLGWTVGAGAEISLDSHWIARAQYRFSDFGYAGSHFVTPFGFVDTRTCSGCPSGVTPLTVSYELPVMQHLFEIGFAYKFWP